MLSEKPTLKFCKVSPLLDVFEVQRGNTTKPLWIYHSKCAQAKVPKGRMLQVVRQGYGFAQTVGVSDADGEFKRQKKKKGYL